MDIINQANFRGLMPGAYRSNVPKEVRLCNDLLRRELGTFGSYPVATNLEYGIPIFRTIPGSETPHYQWLWSENLTRRVRDANFKEVSVPGSSLVMLERKWLTVRATSVPRNQWLIVKALAVESEALWRLRMPEELEYPGSVYFVETSFGGRPLHTPTPNLELTRSIIYEIKSDREMLKLSPEERERVMETKRKAAEESKMAEARQSAMAWIDKRVPVRPCMPGKRNAPVWHRRGSQETALVIEK